MNELSEKEKKLKNRIDALGECIMEKIRQSQDDVSKALAPIFARAK
jgi:hypothetical protein